MKIRPGTSGGSIQFIVEAETPADKVLIDVFYQQYRQRPFTFHGITSDISGAKSFNFGTTPYLKHPYHLHPKWFRTWCYRRAYGLPIQWWWPFTRFSRKYYAKTTT